MYNININKYLFTAKIIIRSIYIHEGGSILMNKFKIFIIGVFVILLLSGCSADKKITASANSRVQNTTSKSDNPVDLNSLHIALPSGWTKRGNESEIFFDNENKQAVGGISVLGYYNNYPTLPNHSETIKSEDINTALGSGKLFTLKRSEPAASGSNKTWTEMHALIPINDRNLEYDFWIIGNRDMLLKILKDSGLNPSVSQ